VSVFSKDLLLTHIQTAKNECPFGTHYSLTDILLWNFNTNITQLQRFVDDGDFRGEFVRGSVFQDIVLQPSLSIFHSTQTIFIVLQQSRPPVGILRRETGKDASRQKKHTKRVRFVVANRNTRKVTSL
jgi:hypothetical protein